MWSCTVAPSKMPFIRSRAGLRSGRRLGGRVRATSALTRCAKEAVAANQSSELNRMILSENNAVGLVLPGYVLGLDRY